jgi:hypothetical protein
VVEGEPTIKEMNSTANLDGIHAREYVEESEMYGSWMGQRLVELRFKGFSVKIKINERSDQIEITINLTRNMGDDGWLSLATTSPSKFR